MAKVEAGGNQGPNYLEVAKAYARTAIRRCIGAFIQASPPEPCEDVEDLLDHLHIGPRELLDIYHVFHDLAQQQSDENEGEIIHIAGEVSVDICEKLVKSRRKWVARILRQLLVLGECTSIVSWDKFLYVFLQFNSLSRVELCQMLFLIIVEEVESETFHYLTADQLQEFYYDWEKCPVRAFSTEYISFEKLPLSRYYMSDFCELVQRFTQLINPTIHLQRSIQELIPSLDFWDYFDRGDIACRKITKDFFRMEKTRIYLRGDPPFRETCDMLLPDALGSKPCNLQQWQLRTGGLQQLDSFGEQLSPEEIEEEIQELEEALRQEELERQQLEKEAEEQALLSGDKAAAATTALVPDPNKPGSAGSKSGPQSVKKAAKPSSPSPSKTPRKSPSKTPSEIPPEKLSMYAATLNEEDNPPFEELPPRWMRNCAAVVAPAPTVFGADPPLHLLQKKVSRIRPSATESNDLSRNSMSR